MRQFVVRYTHSTPFRKRTCHREVYGIRGLLYNHIQKLASLPLEGPSQNGDHIRYSTETSARLIQLFDNVLQEDYSREHSSLRIIPQSSKPLGCDFCGGNLFLSAFLCAGKCGIDEITHSQNVTLAVCPTCFVEGRTCLCGKMTPVRLGSFSFALQARNLAAAIIRRNSNEDLSDLNER